MERFALTRHSRAGLCTAVPAGLAWGAAPVPGTHVPSWILASPAGLRVEVRPCTLTCRARFWNPQTAEDVPNASRRYPVTAIQNPARDVSPGLGIGNCVESRRDGRNRVACYFSRVSHNRISLRVHCIFSTKSRDCHIPSDLQDRAWAFIGGIARNIGLTAIAVGGVMDHVHILVLLPPTVALSSAIQRIKANSSRWIHEQTSRPFEWQEGYAAFSIGISQTDATVQYILHQREHHAREGFGEEIARILAKHGGA